MVSLKRQKGVVSLHIPFLVAVLSLLFLISYTLFEQWLQNYKLERMAYFSASVLADTELEYIDETSNQLYKYAMHYIYDNNEDNEGRGGFKSKKVSGGDKLYENTIGIGCGDSELYSYDPVDVSFTITHVQICTSEKKSATKIRLSSAN